MITKDFITWEECPPIWDITEQWQATGTGTMVYTNGKYYSVFGLHTSRMKEQSKLISQEMLDYFKEHNETEILTFADIFDKGKFPIGASYAVSDDGINFTMGEKIISNVENPSVYAKDGKLIMFSSGNIWQSESVDQPWRVLRKDFPLCGENSKMLNTEECPSYFEWNGYKYLIMGFSGFWSASKDGNFHDSAAEGYDIYEGLAVPMVAVTDNNRAIMAGWLGGISWASAVVHRELVHLGSGILGSRWIPELMPKINLLEEQTDVIEYDIPNAYAEYYIEINVKTDTGGRFAIKFFDENNGGCELQLDFGLKQAQFSDVKSNSEMSGTIQPLYKVIDKIRKLDNHSYGNTINYDALPWHSRNFCIANIFYTENCTLRLLMYYSAKMGTTVIDVEIDGKRTMITNRNDLIVKKIKSLSSDNVCMKIARIYKAKGCLGE